MVIFQSYVKLPEGNSDLRDLLVVNSDGLIVVNWL